LDYRSQPSCLSSVNHTSSKLLAPPTQTPPPAYRTYRYYTGMKRIAPNDTPPCRPADDSSTVNFTLPPHTRRLLFYVIDRKPQKNIQFLFVLKVAALKQQISILYPQILSTEHSFYIYDRPLTEMNVMASLCVEFAGTILIFAVLKRRLFNEEKLKRFSNNISLCLRNGAR